jgi:dolichol kinase
VTAGGPSQVTEAAGGAAASALRHAARREDVRRVVHAVSGVLGVLALRFSGRGAGEVLLGGLAVLALALEAARRILPSVQRAVTAVGGALFRPDEESAVSGPTLLACGYAAAWWLFVPQVAATAIVVAALADPAAALVGRRFGRGPGKSWAGTAACAAVAGAVIVVAGAAGPSAGAGAVAAALAERAPWRGADNLLVPLAVGATLTVLGRR